MKCIRKSDLDMFLKSRGEIQLLNLINGLPTIEVEDTKSGSAKRVAKKEWIVFKEKGERELYRCSLKGYMCGEITDTISILAYEKGLKTEDITVNIE